MEVLAMVQQAQPDQLLRALSSQLGVNPQDLEERARQSKLAYAAQVAAIQDGCTCRACQLLRRTVDGLVDDAMKEITRPSTADPIKAVRAPLAAPPEG